MITDYITNQKMVPGFACLFRGEDSDQLESLEFGALFGFLHCCSDGEQHAGFYTGFLHQILRTF